MAYEYIEIPEYYDLQYEANISMIENNRNLFAETDILKKIAKENLFHDVKIEGNAMSKKQIEEFLSNEVTIRGISLRDHLQVKNFNVSIDEIFNSLIKGEDIATVDNILATHFMVTKGELEEHECGKFREIPVQIRGTNYIPPYEQDVPDLVKELCEQYHRPLGLQTQFERICEFKMNFEKIHPFVDGNGRTGRILMNSMLIKEGYGCISFPFLERTHYFDSLDKGYFSQFASEKMLESQNRILNFIKDKEKNIERNIDYELQR